MRPFALLAAAAVAVTLLAGCSSKPEVPDAGLPSPTGGTGPGPSDGNSTRVQMQFLGGFQEGEVAIAESFAQTDVCTFFVSQCPQRVVDLTPIVPADVPVELAVTLAVNSNLFAYLQTSEDVSVVQSSSQYSGSEIALDALVVRAGSGTVELVIMSQFPSFEAVSSGASATGTAHSVVRSSVVPAYVPVAAQLGPGDAVNATGDGLEQLIAFAPDGVTVRDTTAPFGFVLPATAAQGTYILFVVADEAVRLIGPAERPLTAHRLLYLMTDPTPLQSGTAATFEAAVPGLPVWLAVVLESSENVPGCCSAGSFVGSHSVRLTGPGSVDLMTEQQDCLPFLDCPASLVGYYSMWYATEFLGETLVPGTYAAEVTADQANNANAYIYASYIA